MQEKEINKKIVKYIRNILLSVEDNNSSLARKYGINEKTIRLIKENDSYRIGLKTLINICEGEKISLSEFCKKAGV